MEALERVSDQEPTDGRRQEELAEQLSAKQPVCGSDVPPPDEEDLDKDIWDDPPAPGAPVARGYFGALLRKTKGVPPYVRVVNQHDEDITVVVSKHRPNRLLTGVDINISTAGGGFGLSQTTYLGPATKKTLAPEFKDPAASKGTFPLWSSKDGFGVVSIFTGPQQTLHIENDRIPAGATAYASRAPDLRIEPYGKGSAEK